MPRLRSIALTLFLTLTVTSFAIIAALLLLLRLSIGESFSDYVSRMELERLDIPAHYLLDRYQQAGSWRFVRTPVDLLAPDGGHLPPFHGPMNALPPPETRDSLQLGMRLALFDTGQHLLMGPTAAISRPKRALKQADGKVIGYLGLAPAFDSGAESSLTRQFLEEQTRNIVWGGAVSLLLSALAAAWLARHFRRPLSELAEVAGQLARGHFSTRATADRADELGELARDFNRMAQILEHSEQARRQFIADTSHELRTPLTVMRAYTEAMRDGVMPLDQRGVDRLGSAIADLEHLTDDLYQLARADLGVYEYRLESIPIAMLFNDLAENFAAPMQQGGLRFHIENPPQVSLRGDLARLKQLFSNLLGNSLRYTDPGGEIRLTAHAARGWVDIVLDDTAPGVPDHALPHLFKRFFRVDASRSRASGGAGLGLAICQSIVAGHGGEIIADHSPLGGLRITVRLPQMEEKS